MIKKDKINRDTSETEFNYSIKGDFLIPNKKIYLNNGSVGPLPLSTIKSITDFNLRYSEQGPDSKKFNEYLEDLKKETRKRVADLINCKSNEIIFTQSTTEGINFITNGLSWKKNDKIILRNSRNEHFSNYLPWIKVAIDKKLQVDIFPNSDENKILDDLKESLNLKIPKIVTTSHIMYNNGSITPVEEIGKIIRDKTDKALFSIDGAQSVGAIEVDVKKINCDFLSFPAFKWICGPLGIGILYVNEKLLDGDFLPIFVGSGTAKIKSRKIVNKKDNFSISINNQKQIEELDYFGYPEKYHPTFRNYPGLAGLEASLRYLLRLGISNIYKKNLKLSKLFREEIIKIDDIVIHEDIDEDFRSSMICFSFRKDSDSKVSYLVEKLQEEGIILAEREIGQKKIVRSSPHFFNSEEEIIKTTNEIKRILTHYG